MLLGGGGGLLLKTASSEDSGEEHELQIGAFSLGGGEAFGDSMAAALEIAEDRARWRELHAQEYRSYIRAFADDLMVLGRLDEDRAG